MIKFKLIILCYIFILSSCNSYENNIETELIDDYTEVMSHNTFSNKEVYSFFSNNSYYKNAIYEPEDGVYLGAYILSNRYVDFDIKEFEKQVSVPHTLYTNKMLVGDEFPEDWILKCISLNKTPNIILSHSSEFSPFDIDKIEEIAQQFGQFNVPIFLHFFPEQRQHGYNSEEYVEFFKYSRQIFETYAPNVAFVWTIFEDDVLDSDVFYPGDEYVDWVGINLYKNVVPNGDPFRENTFERLDIFYHTYQERKPIMISEFGVSHFSTINHVYHPILAGEEIIEFYETVLNHYPRIKAIVYMDVNTINYPTKINYKDNFSITSNHLVLESYTNVVKDDRFVRQVNLSKENVVTPQLIKSPFNSYKINNKIYVSENTLIYDLDKKNLAYPSTYILEIDGHKYYDILILEKYNMYNLDIDNEQSRIVLK